MAYIIEKALLNTSEEQIKGFWKKNFPNWPESKFDWFYKSNPYGEAQCWLVKEEKNDKIVGMTASFPRNISMNGQIIKAYITGDYGVDKEHRILGPALKLQREVVKFCDDGDADLKYGYPNSNSEPVQKRVGFEVVGNVIRIVKVLKSVSYIKRFIKLAPLAAFISIPVDFCIKVFSGEVKTGGAKKYYSVITEKFEKHYDDLWQENKSETRLIGEKSRAFLNWRYSDCPYYDYRVFELFLTADKRFLGFIVFRLEDDQVVISDLFYQSGTLAVLLNKFIRYTRENKYHTISIIYFGDEKIVDQFKKYGFSIREENRKIVMYSTLKDKKSYLLDKNNWCLFEGDND